MYPMYASFASFQDWDCIYTFCYELSPSTKKSNKINGFFDQRNDPAKVNAAPFAAKIFRNALVKPAQKNYYITLDRQTEKSLLYKNSAWNIGNPENFGSIPAAAFSHKIGIIIPENNFQTDTSFIDMKLAKEEDFMEQKQFSDTEELYWDRKTGLFIACTEKLTVTVSLKDSVLPDFPQQWLQKDRILPLQGNSSFASVIALNENNNILIYNCSWRGNKNENLRAYNSTKSFSTCYDEISLTTDAEYGIAPVYALAADGFLQLYDGIKIDLHKDSGSLWKVIMRKDVKSFF